MGDQTLTREQALLLLHDHLGEPGYVGLWAEVPATDDAPPGAIGVLEAHGVLAHALDVADTADMPAAQRDVFGTLYKVGDQPFTLPALPGTITERDHGLDFALTEGLTLRVAWQAPGERGELGSA